MLPGSEAVQRVLDVDLDFFVHGVASFRDPEVGRLDGDEYPPLDDRRSDVVPARAMRT